MNQRYPVAASQAPVAFSGRRQSATRPAPTNVNPAVIAKPAVSHGWVSWLLEATSAAAATASAIATKPAMPNRSASHPGLTEAER